jgi:beta-lactamase regulating signal transducer with metallopeptidase domain
MASEHPVLERLLVASLELIAVTIVVWAIIRIARVRSNRVISLLWLVVLANTIFGLAFGEPAPVLNFGSLNVIATSTATVTTKTFESSPDGVVLRTAGETSAKALPMVVGALTTISMFRAMDPHNAVLALWLTGVCLMGLLSIADRLRIRRLVTTAEAPSPVILSFYEAAGGGSKAERLPRLLVTDRLESPAIAGTFAPVVFLPAWMTRDGDRDRIVWSLRHELTHWRHRDPLAGLVGEIARILFYFHPLVWWIGKRWKVATEIACDQALVGNRGDARRYAEQLYQILTRVHTRRRIMLANGLFATRTQIGKRIEILLKSRPRSKAGHKLPAVMFLLVFAAMVFLMGAEISPQAQSSTVIVKSDDKKSSKITTTIHEDEDGKRDIVISSCGVVKLSDDKYDILSISNDGQLKIFETRDDVERELKVTPGKDGKLEWVYKVDGKKKEFDNEAREWFHECMRHFKTDSEGRYVLMTRPGRWTAEECDEDGRSHIRVGIVEPDELIDIYLDDELETIIEMELREDDDDARIVIRSTGEVIHKDGDHVTFNITPSGKMVITVEKDGDKHELEVLSGDDEPEYIYKVNGKKRPYDDDAKKIFERYLDRLEDGFSIHPKGKKI